MQSYCFNNTEKVLFEIGLDDWAINPRKLKTNVFCFLTWEKDGSLSPDKNEYSTIDDFYRSVGGTKEFSRSNLEKALAVSGYMFFPISKNKFDYLYEIKDEEVEQPVVGYIFQKMSVLREYYKQWKQIVDRELFEYNQYICHDIYFSNKYNKNGCFENQSNIYDVSAYIKQNNAAVLGVYCCIEECLADNPGLFDSDCDVIELSEEKKPEKKKSPLRMIYDNMLR